MKAMLQHGLEFTDRRGATWPLGLPDGIRKLCLGVAGPWLLFTLVVYLFAFAGGFVQTWGRDYTPTFNHFRTAFDVQWGAYGWVWAGTAWNSLFTTLSLAAMAAPLGIKSFSSTVGGRCQTGLKFN